MKKLTMVTLFMLMWIGQAMAQTCKTTSSASSAKPTADFVDNGDGTVTHKKTGLMWKRCSEGQTWNGTTCTGFLTAYTWKLALQRGAHASFAGHTDWRVPTVKDLRSIVEKQCTNPAINAVIFPTTASKWYWSASQSAVNATYAWLIAFNDGDESVGRKNGSYYVRLVRGGR